MELLHLEILHEGLWRKCLSMLGANVVLATEMTMPQFISFDTMIM